MTLTYLITNKTPILLIFILEETCYFLDLCQVVVTNVISDLLRFFKSKKHKRMRHMFAQKVHY